MKEGNLFLYDCCAGEMAKKKTERGGGETSLSSRDLGVYEYFVRGERSSGGGAEKVL